MLRIFAAAAAVTVREESSEEFSLPRVVDWLVITRVVTLSSNKSSFKASTMLSSVSLKTTSPE